MGISFDDEGQATEDWGTDYGGSPNSGYGVTQTAVPEEPAVPPDTGDTGDNGDNGNGPNTDIDWDNVWWRKDLAGEWNAPDKPGSFGSVGSGGAGGAGQVGDVGDFSFDQYEYNPYGGSEMTAETYTADTYNANPLAQDYQYQDFTSPNEAVDFREFQAPTQQEAAADQGYQFRLAEGQRALENSAAAKGMLRTGNTWKDLQNYGQGAASQEYDKVYGRRMGEHGMAYQQELQANQDQYGRATQDWQMNRQNQADMYGRSLTDDQRRMQAQQLTEQSRTGAQQRSEQSRFGAHAANLGMYQTNEAMRSGAWDRNYMGGQAQYDYGLRRAEQEAAMAESAAGRAMSASAANASANERAYNTSYNRSRQEYLDAYNINREQTSDRWKRDRYWDQFAVGD
jgi:hypothetical protein|tara:strand:+ start:888 stop:2078 length:1191 start_codon:yes stop_codon:yes gene_type:complete